VVKKRKTPFRMCLGCREYKDKRQLIRVVRTPEKEIILDFSGKKAGRGAYICSDVECLRKAVKGKGMEKSLRSAIPEEILFELKNKLEMSSAAENERQ